MKTHLNDLKWGIPLYSIQNVTHPQNSDQLPTIVTYPPIQNGDFESIEPFGC